MVNKNFLDFFLIQQKWFLPLKNWYLVVYSWHYYARILRPISSFNCHPCLLDLKLFSLHVKCYAWRISAVVHGSSGRGCSPGTKGKYAEMHLRHWKHDLLLLFLTGIPMMVAVLSSPTSVKREALFFVTVTSHCKDGY